MSQPFWLLEKRGEYLAFFADLQFFPLADILGAVAQGATEEPAEMAALKLPGGALLLEGALLFFPARNKRICSPPLIDQQKIELSFDMGGYGSPALLIAVDGFQRHAEEF